MSKILIFDCDGVLAETEQLGHLPAFNQMWKELGIPWEWAGEEYGRKLKIGGGKERMASLWQDAGFLAKVDPPRSEAERAAMTAAWHKRKTAIYTEIIDSGAYQPGPGSSGCARPRSPLAGASPSPPPRPRSPWKQCCGTASARPRRPGSPWYWPEMCVKAKKPAPDIYLLAARAAQVSPGRCVVIEDSQNGLEAAHAAGMKCIVTVSAYTRGEDFHLADLVLSCLGDPGGESCEILANRSAARPGAYGRGPAAGPGR